MASWFEQRSPRTKVRATDPATSVRAAFEAAPRAGTQRARILDAILAAPEGLHYDDVAAQTGIPAVSASTRITELARGGFIFPDGDRPTRAGGAATVWVASRKAREALSEAAPTPRRGELAEAASLSVSEGPWGVGRSGGNGRKSPGRLPCSFERRAAASGGRMTLAAPPVERYYVVTVEGWLQPRSGRHREGAGLSATVLDRLCAHQALRTWRTEDWGADSTFSQERRKSLVVEYAQALADRLNAEDAEAVA
jgi:hypothetical protein